MPSPSPAPTGAASLEGENVFVMTEAGPSTQDIRPLHVAIVNLMPTRWRPGPAPAPSRQHPPSARITLVRMESHDPRNTAAAHLDAFISRRRHGSGNTTASSSTRARRSDTSVRGGRLLKPELCSVIDWSHDHVSPTPRLLGAQAGLKHRYGIEKSIVGRCSAFSPSRSRPARNRVLQAFDAGVPRAALAAHRNGRQISRRRRGSTCSPSVMRQVYLAGTPGILTLCHRASPNMNGTLKNITTGHRPRVGHRSPAALLPRRRSGP